MAGFIFYLCILGCVEEVNISTECPYEVLGVFYDKSEPKILECKTKVIKIKLGVMT